MKGASAILCYHLLGYGQARRVYGKIATRLRESRIPSWTVSRYTRVRRIGVGLLRSARQLMRKDCARRGKETTRSWNMQYRSRSISISSARRSGSRQRPLASQRALITVGAVVNAHSVSSQCLDVL